MILAILIALMVAVVVAFLVIEVLSRGTVASTPVENALIVDKDSSTQYTFSIIINGLQYPQFRPVYKLKVEYNGTTEVWEVEDSTYNECQVGGRIDRDENGDLYCHP